MEETRKIYLVGNNQGFLLATNGGMTQNEIEAMSFTTIGGAMKMCMIHNDGIENGDNFCKVIPYWVKTE